MSRTGLLGDIKNLAGKSAIYGLGTVLLRGISFLTLPLFSRYLTAADYGVIAVAATVSGVLGIIYPLGLHGALTAFYFNAREEQDRRQTLGTIWVGMMLAALGMTILLDICGARLFSVMFPEVPFHPYLRMAIWTAFISMFGLYQACIFQIQERAGATVLLSIANTLLSIALLVWFVVIQKKGAYGNLFGMLVSSSLLAVPIIVTTLRDIKITLYWGKLKSALAYSLPLVPHGMASWILDLSDRMILAHYVSVSEIGRYYIGYQLGAVMNMVATAINNAYVPFLFKTHSAAESGENTRLPRLATYYAMFLTWTALGLALLTKSLLVLLTPSSFHSASRIVPWIVGGYLLNGLYYIPINFLFLKEKTKFVPVVTITAGIVNVALNLLLVPRYGIMAAAWATTTAYGVMLLMAWAISSRVFPFAYEYGRLGRLITTAVLLLLVGSALSLSSLLTETIVRSVLWLSFPAVLYVIGTFTLSEKENAIAFAARKVSALRQTIIRV